MEVRLLWSSGPYDVTYTRAHPTRLGWDFQNLRVLRRTSLRARDQGTVSRGTRPGYVISPLKLIRAQILTIDLAPVFSVPTHTHAAYQIKAFGHRFNKHVLRRKVGPMPPLYEHEGAIGEKTYTSGSFGAA